MSSTSHAPRPGAPARSLQVTNETVYREALYQLMMLMPEQHPAYELARRTLVRLEALLKATITRLYSVAMSVPSEPGGVSIRPTMINGSVTVVASVS